MLNCVPATMYKKNSSMLAKIISMIHDNKEYSAAQSTEDEVEQSSPFNHKKYLFENFHISLLLSLSLSLSPYSRVPQMQPTCLQMELERPHPLMLFQSMFKNRFCPQRMSFSLFCSTNLQKLTNFTRKRNTSMPLG